MSTAAEGGYGPSLPELVRPRWRALRFWQKGVAVLAAAALLIGALAYYQSRRQSIETFTYRGAATPAFTLKHSASLRRPAPHGRELLRLESVRDSTLAQRIVITPLRFTAGGSTFGRLPLDAASYRARAARRYRGFRPFLEGRTRLNGVEGYQVVFTARHLPPRGVERRLFGKIVLLPEDVERPKRGVAIEMLATTLSPIREPGSVGNAGLLKKPFRSFRYL